MEGDMSKSKGRKEKQKDKSQAKVKKDTTAMKSAASKVQTTLGVFKKK